MKVFFKRVAVVCTVVSATLLVNLPAQATTAAGFPFFSATNTDTMPSLAPML